MLEAQARQDAAPEENSAPQLQVYNTLTRRKEPFVPLHPPRVGIYLCGPTVYKPSHIGHMVGPVIFDVIKRYLTYCGYEVTLVINITDVDDKLIAESHRRGIPMAELAREMTEDYFHNLEALGVDTVDHFPRATEYIPAMIQYIQKLIDRGYAYVSGGDVFFDVTRLPGYGKLSNRTLEQMQGEGGEAAARKRSPHDFALWKSAKPGEPSWGSPWGPGRPGWHIECSVMSQHLLGQPFDIHGGGLDLVFPHHENEIAQAEGYAGEPLARYWLHNGLMRAADETGKVGGRHTRPLGEESAEAQAAAKISKSTGAQPFRQLLERFSPEAVRLLVISTHYRSPILFSDQELHRQEERLQRFYRYFQRFEQITGQSFYQLEAPTCRTEGELDPGQSELLQHVAQLRRRFLAHMDDDFNTAGAIGVLFELLHELNRFVQQHQLETRPDPDRVEELRRATVVLRELSGVLGLFRRPVQPKAQAGDQLAQQLIQLLVDLRAQARKEKNFALADQIRDSLGQLGIRLEDRPQGTTWTIEQKKGG